MSRHDSLRPCMDVIDEIMTQMVCPLLMQASYFSNLMCFESSVSDKWIPKSCSKAAVQIWLVWTDLCLPNSVDELTSQWFCRWRRIQHSNHQVEEWVKVTWITTQMKNPWLHSRGAFSKHRVLTTDTKGKYCCAVPTRFFLLLLLSLLWSNAHFFSAVVCSHTQMGATATLCML